MKAYSLLGLALCLTGLIRWGRGTEYFVAVDGRADATGATDDAWDIVSTLAGQRPVKPGDTVWLRGGTYQCEDAYKTKQLYGISSLAARHANDGLRAYYFALAVLSWFLHPVAFMLATAWVTAVLYRREFLSRALNILK